MIMRSLAVIALPLLLLGCVSNTLTNLTATSQPKNPKNLYLIEYQWDSNEQALVPDSIKPYVLVGFDSYEMQKTPKMTNRWEVLIPVPPDKDSVIYRFKVDSEYLGFGERRKSSKSSPEYKLYIR